MQPRVAAPEANDFSAAAANGRGCEAGFGLRLRRWLERIYELAPANSRPRMQAMEGLRGLAILLVFFCHYFDIIVSHLPTGEFTTRFGRGVMEAGGTGVALFFVLSGMLIYRALLKPGMKYHRFLARRVQRIYPTFVALFLLYIGMNAVLAMRPHASPFSARIPSGVIPASLYLLANLAFLPGLFPIQPLMNVAWSLSYEWSFYLLLPIVLMLTGLGRWQPVKRIVLLASISAVFLASCFFVPGFFFLQSNPIHSSHIDFVMFLCGMIVSDLMLVRAGESRRWLDAIAAALLLVGLLAPFLYGFNGAVRPQRGPGDVRTAAIEGLGLFTAYGTLTYCALQGRGALNRLFRVAPLRWMGNMSYSFYLVHGLPMHFIAVLVTRRAILSLPSAQVLTLVAVLLPLTFILTAGISTALFLAVEKPLSLNLKVSAGRS